MHAGDACRAYSVVKLLLCKCSSAVAEGGDLLFRGLCAFEGACIAHHGLVVLANLVEFVAGILLSSEALQRTLNRVESVSY